MGSATVAALASAAAFGLCDFLAGVASRRLSFWWVALVSLVASTGLAWVVVLLSAPGPQERVVWWGVVAGVGAATGASALYRGYGRGQMAVAGPLSAVGAAAIPAVVGALLGERLSALAITGVVIAMPAIWLVSGAGRGGGGARRGTLDGLVSGVGFAAEFVGLARAGTVAGLWPVAVSQSTALVLIGAIVVVRRPQSRLRARPLGWAVLAGVLSLAATSLYFIAATAGLLTVAAVLAGLYPAVTVLLAAILLRERPDRVQLLGLVIAGVAVVLITVF